MESTKVGQAGGDTDGGPETKGNLSLFENQEETNVVQEGKAEKFSKGIVTLNRLSKSLMNAVKNPRYTIVHDNGPSNIGNIHQLFTFLQMSSYSGSKLSTYKVKKRYKFIQIFKLKMFQCLNYSLRNSDFFVYV